MSSRALSTRLHAALVSHQRGEIARAEREYRDILRVAPNYSEALHYLGVCRLQQDDVTSAVELLTKAIQISPGDASAHANLGNALMRAGDSARAAAVFERAVSLHPGVSAFHSRHGDALLACGRAKDALAAYDRAIGLEPNSFEAHNNRGNALRELSDPLSALHAFDRARQLAPGHPVPLNNRGSALLELRRPSEALASCMEALTLQPDYADAAYNAGSALMDIGQLDEAIQHFEKALALDPGYLKAAFNLGIALELAKRHEHSARHFARLLEMQPDYSYALGHLVAARMHSCDWQGLEELRAELIHGVEQGWRVCDPFTLLYVSDAAELQLRCARQFVGNEFPQTEKTSRAEVPAAGAARARETDRLRVAYVSADFHDHATARLIAEVFEKHDRRRFEITGISFGPDDGSAMRQRLVRSFDRFVDVRERPDEDVVRLMHDAGIDIAVDLKGFTANSRTELFLRRAAPLQVSFLGYPGTMGAPFIDYLLADAIVVPEEQRPHYSESIVYLPHCYQPNDSTRPLPPTGPAIDMTREKAGLPATGFVFCSFNNSYKITPEMFDVWVRVLQRTPDSVLWLLADNEAAVRNLRSEAQRRGLEPDRLVFAPRVDFATHTARHRLADLFLDTSPVNAHTTASDALWAGLPVLTCLGSGFASRVAGSLLHAMGLPELATANLSEYEALAVRLADDRESLRRLAERLDRNRETSPLFNAQQFCEHLEAAYSAMWKRHIEGQPPGDIRSSTIRV